MLIFMPWLFIESIVAGLVLALVVGLASLGVGSRLLRNPRSLAELRLSMVLVAVAVLAVSFGLIGVVVSLLKLPLDYPASIAGGVAVFMLLQWLFSPALINVVYHVREAGPELDWLRVEVERLAREAGIKTPKLMVAEIDAPNAFAYGSPIYGNFVAVTRGLLRLLPRDEIVAVIAHEIGHLKHRDVAAILALSVLPAAIYFLGRALIAYAWWGGDRRREQSPATLLAVGAALVAVGFLLHLAIQHFSRLREYYADAHSALATRNPRLLQRALARLHIAYHSVPRYREELSSKGVATYLMIVSFLAGFATAAYEPFEWNRRTLVAGDIDAVVEELKRVEVSPLEELFSTHPPIPKRLRFLDELGKRLSLA